MRLRTLPVSVAGVIMACGYAVGSGVFKWTPALLCLLFAVLCQIASNFANEYYDYRAGRDAAGREGPRRGVTEGDITPAAMKRATFGILAVAALVGLSLTYWGGLWLIAVGAFIGLGALAYSAGPWPLSTHCLGEVAVIVFFGIVPVNLTYYLMACSWDMQVFLGSVAVGFMGANVLVVNNLRDIYDDESVCKHTLATALGPAATITLYVIFGIGAFALTFDTWDALGGAWLAAPALYVLATARIARRLATRTGRALTPYLGITALLMFALSLIFLTANLLR